MSQKWLKTINRLMIPVLLIILVFCWLWMKNQFLRVATLTVYVLLAVLYLNMSEAVRDYIDARRRANNLPVDAMVERHVKIINRLVVVVALAIGIFLCVFTWIYLSPGFLWAAVIFLIPLMLFAGFINVSLTVSHLIIKKPYINPSNAVMALVIILLVSAFTLIYMTMQFFWIILPLIIIGLLAGVYLKVRATIDVLKEIKNKPMDLRRERIVRIFNYAAFIAILAIIVLSRIFGYIGPLPGLDIVGLILLLMIIANVMKVIWDIS